MVFYCIVYQPRHFPRLSYGRDDLLIAFSHFQSPLPLHAFCSTILSKSGVDPPSQIATCPYGFDCVGQKKIISHAVGTSPLLYSMRFHFVFLNGRLVDQPE